MTYNWSRLQPEGVEIERVALDVGWLSAFGLQDGRTWATTRRRGVDRRLKRRQRIAQMSRHQTVSSGGDRTRVALVERASTAATHLSELVIGAQGES
jgi:hypothetical protein